MNNVYRYVPLWDKGIFCLILTFCALNWSGPSIRAQPATGERIAFGAFKDGQWDIFSVSPQGDDLRQLTHDVYEDDQPAYSPDGTRLAYASQRNDNWDIYLLDLRTGTERQLTRHPDYDGDPSWHPNGRQIAFESYRNGDLDIWLMDLSLADSPIPQGGLREPQSNDVPVNLTADSPAGDFGPAWHDQGEVIFFASWSGGNNDIWSLNLETGERKQLTSSEAADSQPTWDAAGERLAFTRNTLGDRDIFSLADSSAEAGQYLWLGSLSQPAFSPDGKSIVGVYQSHNGAQLVKLDEGEPLPRYLTEKTILQGGVSWHAKAVLAGSSISTLDSRDQTSLFVETVAASSSPHGEPYDLIRINDLQTGTPWLADTVDDSYQALRSRLYQEVGYDFLGEVSETLRPINFFSEASQYSSWHKSGRAVDTLFDLPGGRLEIVRENIGGETYWRMLLKCEDQSGSCGRPITANPWDYSARARAVIAPEQGGIEGPNVSGYYVDFTALAELYGWERIASYDDEDFSWTWHFKAFEYWHYQKTTGNGIRNWYQAMLEVYPPFEVEAFFTWEKMRAADEDPYLIVLKGVPVPSKVERWWQTLVP